MSRTFCPDYGVLPVNGGYRPMFTLYAGEPLKLVFYRGGPRYFDTAREARDAAKTHVAALLNKIRAEEITEDADADSFGVESWQQERAERVEEERKRVFGEAKTLFLKGGRQVEVERRDKRRARV